MERTTGFGTKMAKGQAGRAKLKFLLCSAFGCFMFLFPLNNTDSDFNTALSMLTEMLDKSIQANLPWLLTVFVIISSLGALLGQFWRPAVIRRIPWLEDLLFVSRPYALTRLVALLVTVCVVWGVGPEAVRSDDVGGSMISLSQTLIAIAVTLSFVLPFLTDCGIMEFTGILLKPLIRPLFRVPGRASVDLIASWLASSNTAVLITGNQYNSGFYSKREAASIMTNFSLVSIPFCMVVAETLHVTQHFLLLYASVTAIGLLLAVIGVRIRPLASIPDSYCGEKKINEDVPQDVSLVGWAWSAALERAAQFNLRVALHAAIKMTVGIILDLIPIVIAWGTIGTLLVNETAVMQWISYPMGLYLSLFGVEGAFAIAPATLVGFIDMFIPALITSQDLPVSTRFLVAGLSLVQIIYLTEVGSIIVKSNVGLDFKRLFMIFLERTIVAIPLLVLVSHLL
ncbi:nucleoside recognition GATE domain-containing membrane protein YjiH [Selenomonas sp. GACV-9]|uniref:YjiH family protein n=1 Tax=Selenomonas sp. GACV-9 TaxID=3158782 RepID=UPI0008F02A39|nr:nucleoside recognition GATE domain-containing membrane protein YjiH [Selenomonas ruminantium]